MNCVNIPIVHITPMTPDNAIRYGTLVKCPQSKPTTEGETYTFWSDIANYHIEGKTEIGLCTVSAPSGNLLSGVERHLYTPEILIPVDAPFALPLLLEGDNDQSLKVFRVNVGEAVVIHEGVWHGACIPLDKSSATYFVIFKHKTPFEDVEKKSISNVAVRI
ncbi:MAG TPA: hypothetical protein ENO01_03215 [Candidatus Marinimicrobia bacterium]|nr:hypothetical protein [Candidatus Neomarinimicrobiota bacterium]